MNTVVVDVGTGYFVEKVIKLKRQLHLMFIIVCQGCEIILSEKSGFLEREFGKVD